jgi:L,D-peptidoglycan transpeptidase YkuD (ErfK/YbiS/YcfS/YnhG family)
MLRKSGRRCTINAAAVVALLAGGLAAVTSALAAPAAAAIPAAVLACPANPVATYGVDPNALVNDGGGTQLITEVGGLYTSKSATFTAWNKGANGCWTPAALPGQPALPYRSETGYNGFNDHRHEADGTTPTGMYNFLPTIYGNSTVNPNPAYSYHHLVCGDWWDEDSSHVQYNQFVHVPCGTTPSFAAKSEALWKQVAYEHFNVINFNPAPTTNPIGSGIFMHDDTSSGVTAGCIALPNAELDAVLGWMSPAANPHILIATQAEINQLSTRPLPTVGVGAGETVTLHVAGAGTATVLGTLTVTNPTGPGWVTAYPCALNRPLASNINFAAGQTIADAVAVQPDSGGNLCFYTSAATDIIWDQAAETAIASHNATRLLDTRGTG